MLTAFFICFILGISSSSPSQPFSHLVDLNVPEDLDQPDISVSPYRMRQISKVGLKLDWRSLMSVYLKNYQTMGLTQLRGCTVQVLTILNIILKFSVMIMLVT